MTTTKKATPIKKRQPPASKELAESAPAPPYTPLPPSDPRLMSVVCAVCRHLCMSLEELRSKRRHPTLVLARELAVALARRATLCSYPEIADAIRHSPRGRPNHSSVITAHKRYERTKDEIFVPFNASKSSMFNEILASITNKPGRKERARPIEHRKAVASQMSRAPGTRSEPQTTRIVNRSESTTQKGKDHDRAEHRD